MGKIVGQKTPFKLKEIWALRVRLQLEGQVRELALFNLSLDSKLRGCDLVSLKFRDVCHGEQVAPRATVMQHKTQRRVQFELTPGTHEAVQAWIQHSGLRSADLLFPSRMHDSPHLGTRQYARILGGWVRELGLDPAEYGTHSMRRTKATLIYRRTRNPRAVQLLLGTPSLSRPSDTWASRWMTLWRFRTRRKFEPASIERRRSDRLATAVRRIDPLPDGSIWRTAIIQRAAD